MSDLALEDVVLGDIAMALTFGLIEFNTDPVAARLPFYLANKLYYTLLAFMLVGNELNTVAQGEPR